MTTPRPDLLVLVAGTGTEIGKTWVSARLAERLRADGLVVAARKPAQSFEDGDPAPTDADVLGEATGEPPRAVCPSHRWYPVAMAPPMAAEALGQPAPTVAELVAELVWPDGTAVGLVETAGGVASPQAADGAVPELLVALRPDVVVLVADAGLGTINAVRLSLAALQASSDAPVVVHLNRFDGDDDLHRANRAWLADRDGTDVTTDVAALAERLTRPV